MLTIVKGLRGQFVLEADQFKKFPEGLLRLATIARYLKFRKVIVALRKLERSVTCNLLQSIVTAIVSQVDRGVYHSISEVRFATFVENQGLTEADSE